MLKADLSQWTSVSYVSDSDAAFFSVSAPLDSASRPSSEQVSPRRARFCVVARMGKERILEARRSLVVVERTEG